MAHGLPDFQIPINITAQDLANLNVDIVAQTLANLAVDIAAQTLATLGVNIKAQDLAKVAIDIAAQTLSELAIKTSGATKLAVDITTQTLAALKINITAQDLAQLVINIAAQSVGVYLQPEWAGKTGIDKDLFGYQLTATSTTTYDLVDYTVTAGKTLYISHFGAQVDLNNTGITAWVYNKTTTIFKAVSGGYIGLFAPLNKPVIIPSNQNVCLRVQHFGASAATIRGHIGGYEL